MASTEAIDLLREMVGELKEIRRLLEGGGGELKSPAPAVEQSKPKVDPFDLFWEVVPRKTAKREARKAYNRAVKIVSMERPNVKVHEYLRTRMATYARSQVVRDGFVVHPATWLNQGRWDDDDAAWGDQEQAAADSRQAEWQRVVNEERMLKGLDDA